MYTYKYRYNVINHRIEPKLTYNPPQPHFYNPPPPQFYNPPSLNNYNYNYNPYKYSNDDLANPKPISSSETLTGISTGVTSSSVNSYNSLQDGKYGKAMKIFTYLLFAYNILYTIAVIIYSIMIFDLDMLDYSIGYFFLFVFSEVFYISYSLRIFIKKSLEDTKCSYSFIVLICSSLPFVSAMVDFTGFRTFPTGHYIIYIGGTSLLFLMSLVYFSVALRYAMVDYI